MPDITVLWRPDLARGDWAVFAPDLQTGDDLATAVLVSLFTDGRAQGGDVIPDGTADRRGWFGDAYLTSPIGSRLWLLERSKAPLEQVRQAAVDYAQEALQWLVDEGVAAAVTVTAEWTKPNWLGAQVVISQPSGAPAILNFQWAWSQGT